MNHISPPYTADLISEEGKKERIEIWQLNTDSPLIASTPGATEQDRANAEFIVQACNEYDRAMAARDMLPVIKDLAAASYDLVSLMAFSPYKAKDFDIKRRAYVLAKERADALISQAEKKENLIL